MSKISSQQENIEIETSDVIERKFCHCTLNTPKLFAVSHHIKIRLLSARNIAQIRSILSQGDPEKLVHAFVTIDWTTASHYCQNVQNMYLTTCSWSRMLQPKF